MPKIQEIYPLPEAALIDPFAFLDPTVADRCCASARMADVLGQAREGDEKRETRQGHNDGVLALLSQYAKGSVSPVEVVDRLQGRIRTSANAEAILRFARDFDVAAAESSKRWRNGTARPLEGVPFGVKDIIDVADTIITCGSFFTGDRIASRDALVVSRLREAGAIPFAITATSEFALGSPHNLRYGPVRNPRDAARWTGGSSTGSGAAVAAGLVPLALGTDTGGSIRVPACWCGISGFKPTRDLVSRDGIAPLSWTLDHCGPMAREVADIAATLSFMTATYDRDLDKACQDALRNHDIRGLRIGVPVNWFIEKVDDQVLSNWQAELSTLARLGANVVELPYLDIAPLYKSGWTIMMAELATLHAARQDNPDHVDAVLSDRLQAGLKITAVDYAKALQARVAAQRILLDAMSNVDLVCTPGVGSEAGFLETMTAEVNGETLDIYEVIPRNTNIFNLTGFPALMLPAGLGRSGMPTGIQIVGRPNADALCLQAGMALQAAIV
ncbi:aspartyl-tRNA(Asn)/glutamyl-tRNA(Gln) amidotransferase subunit A [Burkholderia sp. OAS925]|uniref:amidase n=1 Tax=Paraburkholderia TaxID=1822464 RepID=UPI00178A0B70|nr:amidase [Paraburkholderia graminis]MDR6478886.1 aspartyl-tRNA(Asn)/glutamyl-tRNA(Gln) amidotransferase subunit A [Paraburkholderia graminis]